MASLSQNMLPIINMEDLNPGTESWILTSHKVLHALEEYGCFMALHGGFSQELKNEVFDVLKTLHDLPVETKMKNTSDKPLLGYLGSLDDIRPLYQSMGIENPINFDDVQSFANLMWPSGNDRFSKIIHSYANLVCELENNVRKMVFESYGVEKYHESYNESMSCLLKLMKYRAPKDDESNVGAAIHTDKNFTTILGQNQVDGLEVQMKNDEWVKVDYLPSSFVVMATDAIMAWSNGRLRSPPHRVILNNQEDRYSIALFTFKNGIIEIPKEFVDDEHPPRFKPFDHFKFLDYVSKTLIYLDDRAIKSYCGA